MKKEIIEIAKKRLRDLYGEKPPVRIINRFKQEELMLTEHKMLLWIGFSIFMIKRNYIEYTIQEEKFTIRYMGKKVEIKFNEIEYVIQYSNYTNLLKEKKYELKLKNRQDVHEKLLKIENKSFTKWILKNIDNFKIKKEMFYD